MLDAALIAQCADPSLTPAIVEQFVAAVGSDDPLAITVQWGTKNILVPKPKTAEEALGNMLAWPPFVSASLNCLSVTVPASSSNLTPTS